MLRLVRGAVLAAALWLPTQAAASDACYTWACSGVFCLFDASCSTISGTVVQYQWNFGDGSSQSTTAPDILYSYLDGNVFRKVKVDIYTTVDHVQVMCRIYVPPKPGPPLSSSGTCN